MTANTALFVDFETRSELDLREVGLHRYARHPSTSVWCAAWAIGEMEPIIWNPTLETREPLVHVERGLPVLAHNAPFELEIWNEIMVPRYGWPRLKPEQTYCTMAMAYAQGLPGALEDAALATGLHVLKDTEGRALMLRMARPRSVKPTVWWDEPEKLARLYEYCKQDVRVERELGKRLMPLSATERRVWLMDYRINQRGVAVDVASAKAAVTLAEKMKAEAGAKLSKLTDGAVQAVSAVAAMKEWMATQGVSTAGIAKQDVVDLLAGPLGTSLNPNAEKVRRVLMVRQEVGKASTAKFDVMVNRAGDDGRLRQMYQYHGAATGRWAGRGVQTHNLPRNLPEAETIEKILAFIRAGDDAAIDLLYGPPLTVASNCLRSFFMASPGKKLISGDWANVESRAGAWFANEQWKLDAFRAQDNRTGPDVYKLGASRLLGIPVEAVTKEERQSHGKVPDLAFMYQGGVGSGKTMGKTYGVYATDEEWDARKNAWREAHPRIKAVWKEIQAAAVNAVRNPGETYVCGHPGRQAKYKVVGSFLWCLLPSGRALCYPYAKLLEGEYGPQLTYVGVPSQDDKKKQKIIDDPKNAPNWSRMGTYGGALYNNLIQGTCRDLLASCMLQLDEAGLAIVLHTHDSVAGEVAAAKAEQAAAAMQVMMRALPTWAAGFPLFAECEAGDRFRG